MTMQGRWVVKGTVLQRICRRSTGVAVMTLLVGVLSSSVVGAQDRAAAQKAFEAGQYQQVVDSAASGPDPSVLFLGALSAQKLNATDRANAFFDQLVQRPPNDAWHFVGQSAKQLLAGDDEGALNSANQAVAADGGLSEASYALGLVLFKRQDWAGAAAAFDRASTLQPTFAHAQYYAGLSHYRANRPDLMAARFERFLKLAPDAPERPEVQQIMKTIRGR
jgi:tetratricopeptide (TPR) repeat protein